MHEENGATIMNEPSSQDLSTHENTILEHTDPKQSPWDSHHSTEEKGGVSSSLPQGLVD